MAARVALSRRSWLTAFPAGVAALVGGRAHAAEPVADEPVRLVAAGDLGFSRDLNHAIESDGLDPFAELKGALSAADLGFANLESPLASADVRGRGFRPGAPILRGTPRAAELLARAGLDVVSVANNHVFDLGRAGLEQSLGHVRAAGVEAVGAGASRDEAFRPFLRTVRGVRLGLLAFTYGTNHAAEGGAVVARLRDDPARVIAALRPAVDALVVSVHWGEQFKNAASRDQIALGHRLIDAGADAIVGHHPHVLQGVERYHGRPIVYSLGNFVWGLQSRTELSALALFDFSLTASLRVGLRVLPVLRRAPLGLPRVVGLREGRAVASLVRSQSWRFRTRFEERDDALALVAG